MFINDCAIAEAICIIIMRDQWLISNNKTYPNLKTWLKKAKKVKQKLQAKLDKNQQKRQEQTYIINIKRLAISNRPLIGVYKDILSDPAFILSSNSLNSTFFANIQQLLATMNSISFMLIV